MRTRTRTFSWRKIMIPAIGLIYSFSGFSQEAQNSVLSQGHWIKVGISQTGIYRIDYDYLRDSGLDPDNVDPKSLRVFGNGSGMLPQPNSDPRPVDLVENAIWVAGEEDGAFNPQDYLLFYGQGPDLYQFDPGSESFFYQNHLYTDTTFYFVTSGAGPGKRIQQGSNLGTGLPPITSYDYYVAYESDRVKLLSPGSGREWYGEKFDFTLAQDFSFPVSNLVDGSTIQLVVAAMGQSQGSSNFKVGLNGLTLGELPIQEIDAGTYSLKGTNTVDTFEVQRDQVSIADELVVGLEFVRNTSARSLGYLNYLFLTLERKLVMEGEPLRFRSTASLTNQESTFRIDQFSSEMMVWDVTDPYNPVDQELNRSDQSAAFGVNTELLREFIAFDPSMAEPPLFKGTVPNQNLRGSSVVDMVVVTHPSLLAEAQRLANFRAAFDGIAVQVVTTRQIYNEFSSGAQDITAIRDYLKHLYDQGSGLKYLLLFGKGSYDYKNYLPGPTNLVPIYESRNSLHPIFSYSSDDYFGFLDDSEGQWEESRQGDHLLDIGIGRLPVINLEEAHQVVNKIISYHTNPKSLGEWRKEIVFVADDGDVNIHQRDADKLATLIDTAHSEFDVKKLYMDVYPQVSTPNGEEVPDLNQEIINAVEQGILVVNFIGHGGEAGWAREDILDLQTIKGFSNKDRLPLFVTATCEFGRHDDPNRRSGGELLVNNPKGGAIALVTTARPVFSNTNFQLNSALMSTLFKKENGQYQTLGEIMKFTKNNSLSGSVNRNFSLLGDPSMRLNYPQQSIEITTVNGSQALGDTIINIRALEKVKLGGRIVGPNSQLMADFSGVLSVTIFDKISKTTTLGNESPSVTFLERKSKIFKGQVSVNSGEFEIEFVVPKNISYALDQAKVSMYASDSHMDANGANLNILIGGSTAGIAPDVEPPEIDLYMDSEAFRPGGSTGPSPTFLARVQDESGINITNTGFGQEITASLDGGTAIILNDFYIADIDDFTAGWIRFPLSDLDPGEHTISFKAWDTHNNSSQKMLDFFVGEDAKIAIESVINYPNPFSDKTIFRIGHNREGDNLIIRLDIYSVHGELVRSFDGIYEDSPPSIDAFEWDGRSFQSSQVKNGVYLYRVVLQSIEDGSKIEAIKKLVITN